MPKMLQLAPRRRRSFPRRRARLELEALETRNLLTAIVGPLLVPLAAPDTNDTLDQAVALGDLSSTPVVQVNGEVGDSASGPADVDWYRFTLDQPATVTLTSNRTAASAL